MFALGAERNINHSGSVAPGSIFKCSHCNKSRAERCVLHLDEVAECHCTPHVLEEVLRALILHKK